MIRILKNYSLDDVKKYIKEFLDLAAQDEAVRDLAVQITNGRGNSVVAIYDWVKANVKYTDDPVDTELFIAPTKLVRDFNNHLPMAGDCVDFALLVVSLCRAIGIKANVVLLNTEGKDINHALVEVYSSAVEKKILVDASTDQVPLGWDIHYFDKIVV